MSDGADLQRQGGVKFSFLVKQHAVIGALAAHFARTADNIRDTIPAALTALETEEASEHSQATVLVSTASAKTHSLLLVFTRLALLASLACGRVHDAHLNSSLRLSAGGSLHMRGGEGFHS